MGKPEDLEPGPALGKQVRKSRKTGEKREKQPEKTESCKKSLITQLPICDVKWIHLINFNEYFIVNVLSYCNLQML